MSSRRLRRHLPCTDRRPADSGRWALSFGGSNAEATQLARGLVVRDRHDCRRRAGLVDRLRMVCPMSDLVPHITVHVATSATTDEQLLESWLDSLNSPHSRRNFEQTARRFLAELPMGIRAATVEDVRLRRTAMMTSSRNPMVLYIIGSAKPIF